MDAPSSMLFWKTFPSTVSSPNYICPCWRESPRDRVSPISVAWVCWQIASWPLIKLTLKYTRNEFLLRFTSSVLSGQSGFEVDGRGRERFGYRAIFFGILRKLLEGLFVYAWHNGLGLQVDGVDGEAAGHLIEVDARGCVHSGWREASTGECIRRRHRVTTGVRRANELLGIGADGLIAHA